MWETYFEPFFAVIGIMTVVFTVYVLGLVALGKYADRHGIDLFDPEPR